MVALRYLQGNHPGITLLVRASFLEDTPPSLQDLTYVGEEDHQVASTGEV